MTSFESNTSDLFKTAHAARAASPALATAERYGATYSRALRALRASLQAPRAGRWARTSPGAPPAAWLAGERPRVVTRSGRWARSGPSEGVAGWLTGARPRIGARVRLGRRDGRSNRFYVVAVQAVANPRRPGAALWRASCTKAPPGTESAVAELEALARRAEARVAVALAA